MRGGLDSLVTGDGGRRLDDDAASPGTSSHRSSMRRFLPRFAVEGVANPPGRRYEALSSCLTMDLIDSLQSGLR